MSDESKQAPGMAGQTRPTPSSAPDEHRAGATDPARRRWLRAGLAAPPVLMTVASRPVLGATPFCVPPSAYVSLPTSTPGMYEGSCNGRGPDYWRDAAPTDWPRDVRFNDKFSDWFTPIGPYSDNAKLLDVLKGNLPSPPEREPNNLVGRYVVAALVNNDKDYVAETILRRRTIQHIWTEFSTLNRFTPMPGASWGEVEIVDYLQSTMISA